MNRCQAHGTSIGDLSRWILQLLLMILLVILIISLLQLFRRNDKQYRHIICILLLSHLLTWLRVGATALEKRGWIRSDPQLIIETRQKDIYAAHIIVYLFVLSTLKLNLFSLHHYCVVIRCFFLALLFIWIFVFLTAPSGWGKKVGRGGLLDGL